MTFGEKLKQVRLDLSMSQEELANFLGTSKQVLSRYENNQRVPKISTVYRYSKILEIPLEYLLDESVSTISECPANSKTISAHERSKPLAQGIGKCSESDNLNNESRTAPSELEYAHLQKYRRLNSNGKSRLDEQLNDMLSLEKYTTANSDSEIAQEITPSNVYEPLTSDAEIDAEVEDYRRQLLEEREAAEKSKALRDAKEA